MLASRLPYKWHPPLISGSGTPEQERRHDQIQKVRDRMLAAPPLPWQHCVPRRRRCRCPAPQGINGPTPTGRWGKPLCTGHDTNAYWRGPNAGGIIESAAKHPEGSAGGTPNPTLPPRGGLHPPHALGNPEGNSMASGASSAESTICRRRQSIGDGGFRLANLALTAAAQRSTSGYCFTEGLDADAVDAPWPSSTDERQQYALSFSVTAATTRRPALLRESLSRRRRSLGVVAVRATLDGKPSRSRPRVRPRVQSSHTPGVVVCAITAATMSASTSTTTRRADTTSRGPCLRRRRDVQAYVARRMSQFRRWTPKEPM